MRKYCAPDENKENKEKLDADDQDYVLVNTQNDAKVRANRLTFKFNDDYELNCRQLVIYYQNSPDLRQAPCQ